MTSKIHDTVKLPRAAAPENVGISSAAVIKFFDEINSTNLDYHAFIFMRHGVVAAECYRYPFSPEVTHCLYSVSKSVSSIAAGFAVKEGYLTLDTRVADIFPEYAPNEPDEYFEQVTLRHLLTMTAGKNPSYTLNKTKGDWIRHFTDAPWASAPGEKRKYVNENIFMVCAMLVRVTGISVSEFLKPRLWEPLGINDPYWETDQNGVESGGWGLFLTPESFAKLVNCIASRGIFNGKQVIPAEWLDEAILNQTDKKDGKELPNRDSGYGYCIWRNDDKVYHVAGVFGQLGIVIEDKDAQIVILCGDPDDSPAWKAFRNVSEELFIDDDPNVLPDENFKKTLMSNPADIVPSSELRSFVEKQINGKLISVEKNHASGVIGFPPTVLSVPAVYMTKNRAGNIDDIVFEFSENECVFSWCENDESNKVLCGMDGKYRYSGGRLAGTDYTFCGAAFWLDDNTLEVWIRPLESICRRKMVFKFDNGRVKIDFASSPALSKVLGSISWTIKEMVPNPIAQVVALKGFLKLQDLLEHELNGHYTM